MRNACRVVLRMHKLEPQPPSSLILSHLSLCIQCKLLYANIPHVTASMLSICSAKCLHRAVFHTSVSWLICIYANFLWQGATVRQPQRCTEVYNRLEAEDDTPIGMDVQLTHQRMLLLKIHISVSSRHSTNECLNNNSPFFFC